MSASSKVLKLTQPYPSGTQGQALLGTVVVITGASSGIGECVAYEYAKKGCTLVLAARQQARLEEVAQRCKKEGAADALIKVTDVTKEQDCRSLIEFTITALGQIDVLVLNAGVACHQPFLETEMSTFRQLMEINYFGYLYCAHAALPHLKRTGGSIVVIGSLSGELGLPLRTAYCASKFAVTGLFEALRAELQASDPIVHHSPLEPPHVDRHVHITIVQPGFVKTSIRENSLGPKGQELQHNEPDSKRMSPEECARLIVQAAELKQRKVTMTLGGKAAVLMKPILPGLVEKLAARKTNAKPAAKL